MIKRILAFCVAVAMTISASAQAEAGSLIWQPNVGVTYTTGIVDGLSDPVDGALGLTANDEKLVGKFVTPEQQARIAEDMLKFFS